MVVEGAPWCPISARPWGFSSHLGEEKRQEEDDPTVLT